MAEGPLLSSEEFTIRKPLFQIGLVAFLAAVLVGVFMDATQGNRLAVVFDLITLAALVFVVIAVRVWKLERSQAAAVLLYVGALNFLLAIVQSSLVSRDLLVPVVYNNLFVLALFLGASTFLAGRFSTLVFGATLLLVLALVSLAPEASWVRNNLWLEVPAVAGATWLLYQYRTALDRLLRDLQKVIRENRALRDRERLAALGEMTAGIAHEIKNPLNFVVNFAESSQELLRDLEGHLALPSEERDQEEVQYLLRELHQNLEDIRSQGLRGAATVQSMLLQARSGSGEFQAVDLNELAAESLHLAWMGHRTQRARQEFASWPSPVMVKASRSDLSRALLNLMTNALWSMAARQKRDDADYEPLIRVQVREHEAWGEVSVFDNGLGLSAAVKAQLFVPFFTTKPMGEGTGLGLSLTREIVVDQHGGRLEFEGEPDRGARFSVFLPLLGATR